MSTMCERPLTITFELYVTSANTCQKTLLNDLQHHWLVHVWTTVTQYSMEHHVTTSTNFSVRVQNTLARIVKERGKYDHIELSLSKSQWLPIDTRIRHKTAILTFKATSTGKPSYLAELVHTHTHAPVHGSLTRCMFHTSELLSVAEIFVMQHQYSGMVCCRES